MSMQICIKHWLKCVEIMESKGYSHLISKDREEAIKRLKADIESGTMTRNYDPALHLVWKICHTLAHKTHEGVLIAHSEEPECPLCVMEMLTCESAVHYYMIDIAESIDQDIMKHNLQG